MPGSLRSVMVLLLCLTLGLATAAGAGERSEAEAAYSDLHAAVEAAKLCRGLTLEDADHQRIAAIIDQRSQGLIGTKGLSLLLEAQRQARRTVEEKSCDDGAVTRLLGLFDEALAPALE